MQNSVCFNHISSVSVGIPKTLSISEYRIINKCTTIFVLIIIIVILVIIVIITLNTLLSTKGPSSRLCAVSFNVSFSAY